MSEETKTVSGVLKKDSTAHVPMKNGGSYSYSYASLAAVVEHVNVMNVICQQSVQPPSLNIVNLPTSFLYLGDAITRIKPADKDIGYGEWLAPIPIVVAVGRNLMQEIGRSLSYARRYSLQCALTLAAEDDDGGADVERQPQPVSSQQVEQIQQLLKTAGVANVEAARNVYLTALAGHPVNTARDLTDVQAELVIHLLQKARGGQG